MPAGDEDDEESGEIDFEWIFLWLMHMGFTYQEAQHLTFGQWRDYFTRYKPIHNIIVTQSTFKEPRRIDKIYIPANNFEDEYEE